jgi:DNA-binding LytR/AlgR family response regulator
MADDDRRAGVKRIVVAEDEAVIARRIARLTREILGPDTTFVLAAGVAEAREALREPADILILDLNLEGDEGFDLIRNRPSGQFETIVVSAHSDRALEAFEYGVRDFVAKPFTRERLERALMRISARDASCRYLGIRKRGEIEFVPVDDVVFIRGAGTLSEVILTSGQPVLHDKLLDQLQDVLPPHFDRIHKSYIADLRRVRRLIVREGSRYFVELDDGTLLPVGRTKVPALRKRLG